MTPLVPVIAERASQFTCPLTAIPPLNCRDDNVPMEACLELFPDRLNVLPKLNRASCELWDTDRPIPLDVFVILKGAVISMVDAVAAKIPADTLAFTDRPLKNAVPFSSRIP